MITPAVVNKTYTLENCIGEPIGILFRNSELIGRVVYSHLSSGKLVMTKLRKIDPDGNLVKWLHSVDDEANFDIGLSQDKLFWVPNNTTLDKYNLIFPE